MTFKNMDLVFMAWREKISLEQHREQSANVGDYVIVMAL